MDDDHWRKSSRSVNNGQCVEVATPWRKPSGSIGNGQCAEVQARGGSVLVRDSKHPHSGFLAFGPEAWNNFVAVLKSGLVSQPRQT